MSGYMLDCSSLIFILEQCESGFNVQMETALLVGLEQKWSNTFSISYRNSLRKFWLI